MGNFQAADAGRAAVLAAVTMQAIGKVAYGTMLAAIPSPLFVFFSFSLTAAFFLAFAREGTGERAWTQLLVLNVATAVTFLSFFFALKLIEPAIAVAVNIGIGPLLAALIAWHGTGRRPTARRLITCAGILAGCAILCLSAVRGAGFAGDPRAAWLGIAASAIAGVGTVLITVSSRALLDRGWRPGAVLAHRFHVVVPVSLLLSLGTDFGGIAGLAPLLPALLVITLVGVTLPLYLLQFGIVRCEPYTVMVTMAALPVITFAVEGLSPAYEWSWATAAGLATVTAFLIADMGRPTRAA